MDLSVMKHPSAWIPFSMSLAAFLIVVGHLALPGAVHEVDEGAAAHLWQLLMAGQLPVIVWFAVQWLPRRAAPALLVLALQACAGLAACAPVFWFHL